MKNENMNEYALPFAAWDLRLYLDTHPEDECALREYRRLCAMSGGHCNYACHTPDGHVMPRGGAMPYVGRTADVNGCGCDAPMTRANGGGGNYGGNRCDGGNCRTARAENGGCGNGNETGNGCACDAPITRANGGGGNYGGNRCDGGNYRTARAENGGCGNGNETGNGCGCDAPMTRANGGGGNYGGNRCDGGNYRTARAENSGCGNGNETGNGCGCESRNYHGHGTHVWSWIEGPWPWEPAANGGNC